MTNWIGPVILRPALGAPPMLGSKWSSDCRKAASPMRRRAKGPIWSTGSARATEDGPPPDEHRMCCIATGCSHAAPDVPESPRSTSNCIICLLWTCGCENRHEQHPPGLAGVAIVPVFKSLPGATAIAAITDLDDQFVAEGHIGEFHNLRLARIPLAAIPSVRNDPAFGRRYVRSRATVAAGSEMATRTVARFLWFAIGDAAAIAAVSSVASRCNVKALSDGEGRGVATIASATADCSKNVESLNADRTAAAAAAAAAARDDRQAVPSVPRPLEGA